MNVASIVTATSRGNVARVAGRALRCQVVPPCKHEDVATHGI